jgi:hypothetical protein
MGAVASRCIITVHFVRFRSATWPANVAAQPSRTASGKTSRTHAKTSKPKKPSQRDKSLQAFLSKVAGQWRFQQGNASKAETVRIDDNGNYFVVQNGREQLAFVLCNVEYRPSSSKATFTKVQAGPSDKGVNRQVEVLEIDETASTMTGHVKSDGTTLSASSPMPRSCPPSDLDRHSNGREAGLQRLFRANVACVCVSLSAGQPQCWSSGFSSES